MTREDVKEWLPILQAYAENKTVQIYDNRNAVWEWHDVKELGLIGRADYFRIKPSPTYRPFKDGEELVAEYCKRFGVERKAYEMPQIWVKDKKEGYSNILLTELSNNGCGNYGILYCNYNILFDTYTFLDGSPCGVEEEEQC